MTIKALKMKKRDIHELVADCPTFENDVKNWGRRNKKLFYGLETKEKQ